MPRGPFRHGDFIGQKRIVKVLNQRLNNAEERGTVLDTVLLMGPTGYGKTALVKMLAAERGYDFHTITISKKTTFADLELIFSEVNYFDFLFLDEVHNLNPSIQDQLYRVMDEWAYDKFYNEKDKCGQKIRKKMQISVPRVNLFTATDQPGNGLQYAFHRRVNPVPLEDYSNEELKQIILKNAERDGFDFSPQAAKPISEVSKGCPGVATKLYRACAANLKNIYTKQVTESDARRFLADEAIDPETATNALDRQYLRLLHRMPRKRVSMTTIAALMKYDIRYITRYIEPYLLRREFLVIDSTGRYISEISEQLLERYEHEGKTEDNNRSTSESPAEVSLQRKPTSTSGGQARSGKKRDIKASSKGIKN